MNNAFAHSHKNVKFMKIFDCEINLLHVVVLYQATVNIGFLFSPIRSSLNLAENEKVKISDLQIVERS